MGTHTVGAPHLDQGPDRLFVWTVHLADMVSARAESPEFEEIWDLAFTHGGLQVAYARAYALRAQRLREEGKFVSSSTVELERAAGGTISEVSVPA